MVELCSFLSICVPPPLNKQTNILFCWHHLSAVSVRVMSAAKVYDHGTSFKGELEEVIHSKQSRKSLQMHLATHPTVVLLLGRAIVWEAPGLDNEEAGSIFGIKTVPCTDQPGWLALAIKPAQCTLLWQPEW